jgi:hypothetical protein
MPIGERRGEVVLLLQLLLSFIVHSHCSASVPLPHQTYEECCQLSLLDATRQVAIDTSHAPPPGLMQAMRLRLCTTDPVSVQIWTLVSDKTYAFKWEMIVTPTVEQTNQAFVVINLESNPVTIISGDRVGLYSPMNNSEKIPVPYELDPLSGATQYFSQQRYVVSSKAEGQFLIGQSMTLGDLYWRRSFSNDVTFCSSTADCQAILNDILVDVPQPGLQSSVSSSYPGQCCTVVPEPSCDQSGTIGNNLNNQAQQIIQLENVINQLQQILNNLLNSNIITGTCPAGFVPGVYGIGNCYSIQRNAVQLAQAAIQCEDLYFSTLIQINSELEDTFIKQLIINSSSSVSGTTQSFWTAGIYNIPLRNWFWYNDQLIAQTPFTYRNWLNGMEPSPVGIYDVCSVYTTNVATAIDYWQKESCISTNYYICETPKMCL